MPPPSLWPVGFAIGIVCVLVGLVVSWPAVAVGAVITLVFGFLWVRDVTSGERAHAVEVEPEQREVSPRPGPAIPAHEGHAGMPEPEPGERFPRAKFLELSTLGLGAVIGGAVTVPALGFALVPAFTGEGARGTHDVDLGPLDNFPEGQFVVATFMEDPSQGEVTRRTAYIRNNGAVKGVPSFTVISNRCVHLGCPVQPNGPLFFDKERKFKDVSLTPSLPAGGFGCPCHGGQYDQEGNRTAGPPVRALDRYEFAIRDGHVWLGKTYSVGKVDGAGASAKIHRYQYAGPGEHVDGPEAWLYPLQPPH